MGAYIVRVWLPDRPGALGMVAVALGSVPAEIVGIDILERGGGRAIDELVVELPPGRPVERLVARLQRLDGVDIEEIRPADGTCHDPRSDALDVAAIVAGARQPSEILDALVVHGARLSGASWATVVGLSDGVVRAAWGSGPSVAWLVAFVEGSRSAGVPSADPGVDDVAWAPMSASGLAVVMGREAPPFRSREHRQVGALARIADGQLLAATYGHEGRGLTRR